MNGQVTGRSLELPMALRDALVADAAVRAAEVCGALLSPLGEPLRICDVIALRNRSAQPDAYSIESDSVRRLELAARAQDQYVTGFYHSHPQGGAEPSVRDLEAAWPGYIYVIVGTGMDPELRAWRLLEEGGRFEEIPLRVVPS